MVGPRMNRFHHLLPDVGLRRLLELMQRGTDDATVKAAKRIGVTPEEVVLASHRLWRHGLTEEREARTAAEAAADATPRTLQGVRGAVTRGLIIELQRLFFNVEQWEEQHPEAEEEAREWQRAEMFGAARGAIKSSRETIKESTNAAHC